MNNAQWEECVAFHGHACPGLAIGFQAARAAQIHLGFQSAADEELVCITENDACGVDAVQYLTSCTMGKGNLIFRPAGKQAFSFFLRETGASIRLVWKPRAWPEERQAQMEAIVAADPVELFSVTEPHYGVPEKARLFDTITCENCGEGTAELFIRLQNGRQLCTDCADTYNRGW